MAQFQAYRNPRPSRGRIPFLLDIQSDFVQTPSRVVVPLIPSNRHGPAYERLHPILIVAGKPTVAAFTDMASIPAADLRERVADFSGHRAEFVAALDFLLSGF